MIPRYARPGMAKIWEEREKLGRMLDVELAVCEEMAARGEIPQEALAEIRAKAAFDPERIREIERVTRHDVIAFLTSVAESVGPASRYIHLGMTSSDVLDTGLALQLVSAADVILEDIEKLGRTLKRRAIEHKRTLMAGRTHGMHAEPTTLGLKIAAWYTEFERAGERMRRAREAVRVGQISGAVGACPHIPPDAEEAVCRRLGLEADRASSQIIQRDRHAEYHLALALTAASVSRVATEVRHLQRNEVGEAEEFFHKGQKGSSAMPHKRNPVVSEQLCGLARVVQGNAAAALQNVPLWHERDISHSSVERVILPDSTILVDYMLAKLDDLIRQLDDLPREDAREPRALEGSPAQRARDARPHPQGGRHARGSLRPRSGPRHGDMGRRRRLSDQTGGGPRCGRRPGRSGTRAMLRRGGASEESGRDFRARLRPRRGVKRAGEVTKAGACMLG